MKRLLPLFLCATLLAGCATRPSTPEAPRERGDWAAQQDALKALDAWRLAGKVGIRTPQDSTSANLDWTQNAYSYRMLISGPFGVGRSVLAGSPQGVTLTTGDGRFSAATPEELMEQQLGWALPVSALDNWVRGLPAPIVPHDLETDARGFPDRLHQAGWDIDYQQWVWVPELDGGLWLPRRLTMTFDDLRATLVVNRWYAGESI